MLFVSRYTLSFLCLFAYLSVAAADEDTAALIKQIGKDQPTAVRIQALKELRKINKDNREIALQALPAVRQCLQEKDADLRGAALYTMVEITFSNKLPCPIELLTGMFDPDKGFRDQVGNYVGIYKKYPEEAMPLILKALQSKDPWLRGMGVDGLHGVSQEKGKDPVVLAALRTATMDRNFAVRNNAQVFYYTAAGDLPYYVRFRLQVMGTKIKELVGKDGDHENRKTEKIIASLVTKHNPQIFDDIYKDRPKELMEELTRSLADPSPVIRGMASRTLGTLAKKNPETVKILRDVKTDQTLKKLLDDPVATVRVEAVKALKRIILLEENSQKNQKKKGPEGTPPEPGQLLSHTSH
jgi:HEAT repeat protein